MSTHDTSCDSGADVGSIRSIPVASLSSTSPHLGSAERDGGTGSSDDEESEYQDSERSDSDVEMEDGASEDEVMVGETSARAISPLPVDIDRAYGGAKAGRMKAVAQGHGRV